MRSWRERAVPYAGIVLLTVLAASYTVHLAGDMRAMAMPDASAWDVRDYAWAVAMWVVMMIAMMTPSATPMLVAYDGLRRTARGRRANTAAFGVGYLVVWSAFGVAAASLQWALHDIGMMAGGAMRASPRAAGALLVVAGVWQVTPLRDRCLAKCRSPLAFLMGSWRDGPAGALRMGLAHGWWCVGCCWALMLVLFAAGAMNLAWIAVLAAWVLIEKNVGWRWPAPVAGLAAAGWGLWLLAASIGS